MNYKKMALVLFLVPMMSCGNNVQEAKKQLEQKQSGIKEEIDFLGNRIQDEFMKYIAFYELIHALWTADEKEYPFERFVEEVSDHLLKGNDPTLFIQKCKFLGEIDTSIYSSILRLALKIEDLETKTNQYNLLIKELLLTTKKINDQK